MDQPEDPSSLRSDYARLKQWAYGQYQQGKTYQDVITAVYGVDLPLEAYVFHRSRPRDPELPIEWCWLPWELVEMVGPRYKDDEINSYSEERERRELQRDPDFLPLGVLEAGDGDHEWMLIGYSIARLRIGDTRILGHSDESPERALLVLGSSLLELLQRWMTRYYEKAKAILEHPANRRRGSDSDMVNAREWLKAIEKLQRKLAEQQAGS